MPNISEADRDKLSPVWDMSQERQLMEQLMNTRINFFTIIFGLIFTGALNAKTHCTLTMILICGSLICITLSVAIFRATRKVSIIIGLLKKDDSHPLSIVDKAAGKGSVRWLLGYVLPGLCTAFYVIMAILTIFGCDTPFESAINL